MPPLKNAEGSFYAEKDTEEYERLLLMAAEGLFTVWDVNALRAAKKEYVVFADVDSAPTRATDAFREETGILAEGYERRVDLKNDEAD